MHEKLTEQTIFDTVVEHLLWQNEVSVDRRGRCAYRGLSGLKCAVGVLVTDNEAKYMEPWGSVYFCQKYGALPRRLIPHMKLLTDLQKVHDDASKHCMKAMSVDDWPHELRQVAEKYGLEYRGER